jgi:hypothetical protein
VLRDNSFIHRAMLSLLLHFYTQSKFKVPWPWPAPWPLRRFCRP